MPVHPLHIPPHTRGENSHLPQRAGRRTEAGHGAVCRPQGLDRTHPWPGSRRAAQTAPRSGSPPDDGRGAPLRGHRQPSARRWHYGPLGAPIAHEDHALRACYAALAMQAAMRAMPTRCVAPTACQCGCVSGSTPGRWWCAPLANDLHMDYSAVGQTTILAARMEQLATPGSSC